MTMLLSTKVVIIMQMEKEGMGLLNSDHFIPGDIEPLTYILILQDDN